MCCKNSKNVKQNITHYSMRNNELRCVYVACQIGGSIIDVVSSKGPKYE